MSLCICAQSFGCSSTPVRADEVVCVTQAQNAVVGAPSVRNCAPALSFGASSSLLALWSGALHADRLCGCLLSAHLFIPLSAPLEPVCPLTLPPHELEAMPVLWLVAARQTTMRLLLCFLIWPFTTSCCPALDTEAEPAIFHCFHPSLGCASPPKVGSCKDIRSGSHPFSPRAHVCILFHSVPVQTRQVSWMWGEHGSGTDHHSSSMAPDWGQCLLAGKVSPPHTLSCCVLSPCSYCSSGSGSLPNGRLRHFIGGPSPCVLSATLPCVKR